MTHYVVVFLHHEMKGMTVQAVKHSRDAAQQYIDGKDAYCKSVGVFGILEVSGDE